MTSPLERLERWRWRRFSLADIAFLALLVIALVYLVYEGHGNRFFYDEWTWILYLHSGLHAILAAYNQHMMIAPLAVYQLFFHTIGLDHYRWYRLLATFGHLLLVTAVYLYARRRIGGLALLVVIPLAFLGTGYEFILWGLNFGYTSCFGLGVLAFVLLDSDGRPSGRRAAGTAIVLLLALLCSEEAILFAIAVGVELTWRERSLRRIWVWATPVVLFLVWYAAYYPSGGDLDFGGIPRFGARLAAAAAGAMVGQGEAGGLFGVATTTGWIVLGLILVVLATGIWRRRGVGVRLVAVGLAALGYWALVAVGRAQLGQPNASRYLYAGVVLLLLVLLESLRGLRLSPRVLVVAAAICALCLVGNLKAFGFGEGELYEGSNDTAAELTALRLVPRAAASNFVLDPHWAPQITPALYFPAVADLHSTGADTLAQLLVSPEEPRSDADEVLVRAGELTAVSPASAAPVGSTGPAGGGPHVQLVLDGGLRHAGPCVRFQPAGSGATLDVTLPAGGLSIHTGAQVSPHIPAPTQVRVRRFALGYENPPISSLAAHASVFIHARSDSAPQPWDVRISAWHALTLCTVSR